MLYNIIYNIIYVIKNNLLLLLILLLNFPGSRFTFVNILKCFALVFISFPLDESPDVSMIAWTTTPWTLPSNLALVVNPEMDYVKVKGEEQICIIIYMLMYIMYNMYMVDKCFRPTCFS